MGYRFELLRIEELGEIIDKGHRLVLTGSGTEGSVCDLCRRSRKLSGLRPYRSSIRRAITKKINKAKLLRIKQLWKGIFYIWGKEKMDFGYG